MDRPILEYHRTLIVIVPLFYSDHIHMLVSFYSNLMIPFPLPAQLCGCGYGREVMARDEAEVDGNNAASWIWKQ